MANSLIGIKVGSVESTMARGGKSFYAQMPNNLTHKGEIVSPESLANFIKSVKKKSGVTGANCAIVLPSGTSFFRTVNAPLMSSDQIKLNLPYEFRNFVGNDSAKYSYDYFVNGTDKDEEGNVTSLHLVAAAGLKDICDEYARVLKRAGMKLKLALPKEVCLINIMKKTAEADKEYCLVDLDYEDTSVYMFKGCELVSSKNMDIGCDEIDSTIAAEKRVDEFMAATYRDTNHDDCLALPSLQSTYERIALEVMKTINFYKYEHSENQLDTVYFFSMGSKNTYLADTICQNTGLKYGDIADILPKEYKNDINAARTLITIGLTL